MARKTPRQRGLFGGFEPPPRDPRGRKAIAWNAEVAETVALLVADGATQERIAEAVGLSVKTTVRIYAEELSRGAELIRQAVLASQVRKALTGNTSAANFVMKRLEGEVGDGVYRPRAAPPAAPKLGKKEQRQVDADAVGGIFSPRPPPTRFAH